MNRIDYSNSDLAALGRNEDSFLAHVAPGEMVVPPVISDKTKRRIDTELRYAGLDPRNYHVGEYMTINPITGMPEFGFLSKVFKGVKKVATAPLKISKKIVKSDFFKKWAPIAANFIPIPGVGPLAAMAIRGAIGGLASGKGLKGAALGAAMSAAGGAMGGLKPGMSPALAAGTKITPGNYWKATSFGGNPFTKIKDAFTSMKGGGIKEIFSGLKDVKGGLGGLKTGFAGMSGQGLPSMLQTAFGGQQEVNPMLMNAYGGGQQQVNPMLMQTAYGGGGGYGGGYGGGVGGNPMLMQTAYGGSGGSGGSGGNPMLPSYGPVFENYQQKEFQRLIDSGMDPNAAATYVGNLTPMDRFNQGMPKFERFARGLGGIADSVIQGLYLKRLLEKRKSEARKPTDVVPTGLKAFDAYDNVGDFGIGNLTPTLVEGAQYVNQSPDMAGKGNKVITAEYGGMIDKYEHGGSHDGPGDITPAMLEPGEFVLTRDAVKGAGGPEVLYPLMAQLEARA